MKEDKVMRKELENLDMEKFIFTNGSAEHAENILTHLVFMIYLVEIRFLIFRMVAIFQNQKQNFRFNGQKIWH